MNLKAKNLIRICAAGALVLSVFNCASNKPDTGRKLIWSDEFNGKRPSGFIKMEL